MADPLGDSPASATRSWITAPGPAVEGLADGDVVLVDRNMVWEVMDAVGIAYPGPGAWSSAHALEARWR